jgi:hypothetical protein
VQQDKGSFRGKKTVRKHHGRDQKAPDIRKILEKERGVI